MSAQGPLEEAMRQASVPDSKGLERLLESRRKKSRTLRNGIGVGILAGLFALSPAMEAAADLISGRESVAPEERFEIEQADCGGTPCVDIRPSDELRSAAPDEFNDSKSDGDWLLHGEGGGIRLEVLEEICAELDPEGNTFCASNP